MFLSPGTSKVLGEFTFVFCLRDSISWNFSPFMLMFVLAAYMFEINSKSTVQTEFDTVLIHG